MTKPNANKQADSKTITDEQILQVMADTHLKDKTFLKLVEDDQWLTATDKILAAFWMGDGNRRTVQVAIEVMTNQGVGMDALALLHYMLVSVRQTQELLLNTIMSLRDGITLDTILVMAKQKYGKEGIVPVPVVAAYLLRRISIMELVRLAEEATRNHPDEEPGAIGIKHGTGMIQ